MTMNPGPSSVITVNLQPVLGSFDNSGNLLTMYGPGMVPINLDLILPFAAKGDLLVGVSADLGAVLGIGATGAVLSVAAGTPAWVAQSTLTAGVATKVTVTTVSSNASYSLLMASADTGNLAVDAAASLTYNPSTQTLTLTGTTGYNPGLVVNGANSATGNAVTIAGGYTGAGTNQLVIIEDVNNTNGVCLRLIGNGSTTPSKTITVTAGIFQITNDAFGANILQLTDAGLLSTTGGFAGALNGTVGATTAAAGKFTTVAATGSILGGSSTTGIGYQTGAGAGSTGTQATSGTTTIAMTAACSTGKITMYSAARTTLTPITAAVTSIACAAVDTIVANHVSGGTLGNYVVTMYPTGANTASITLTALATLTEAPVIQFSVIKGSQN